MKKLTTTFLASLLLISILKCQTKNENFVLSTETVQKKDVKSLQLLKFKTFQIIGEYKGKIAISDRDSSERVMMFQLDEKTGITTRDPLEIDQSRNKILGIRRYNDIIVCVGYLGLPENLSNTSLSEIPMTYEYQDLWLSIDNKNYKIDTFPFHYIDKYLDIKLSGDGQYVTVNPFTAQTTGYSPKEDGFIYIYNISNPTKIKKDVILCDKCLTTFYVKDELVFQKDIPEGRGFDGDYHNIYKAPRTNVKDTTRLGFNIELKLISPDKKFALGTKYLHGQRTVVIVDLATKRFQYILGRKYLLDRCYYSGAEKKFAFDFGTHIVYINFPEKYPFDALNQKANRTSKTEDADFWKKYQHQGLK